ncbi:unnamed protein product [Oikopleura dioica]|uniref:Mannosyltransferase n=1 Tax=Oikopleura dioica TaxID=34765 RepID=E4X7T4_OIKDI|nr:unnamed protein product [Oikopleura dioica]
MEYALFTFTLSYFSDDLLSSSSTVYLYPAALSIIMRPTSATFYIPLFLLHFYHSEDRFTLLAKSVKITVIIFALCIGIDSLWFGEYTITPFNFLKINVLDNIAVFYGRNRFFGWYLTQGLPVSCGFSFIFALVGIFQCQMFTKVEQGLLITLVFNWLILEIGSEHKEFRFIMSALAILTILGAKAAARVFQTEWIKKLYIAVNFMIAVYLSMVHQRGPADLARYLRVELCSNAEGASIRFFGPCHVMPGEYSRFCLKGNHLDLVQLECPPPIPGISENSKTEVDLFHEDPEDFLYKDLSRKKYEYLAFFDKHESKLERTLLELEYFQIKSFFHSPSPLDDASRNIVLYKLKK